MKLFSKRKTPAEEVTFKQRVETFWQWWSEHAVRIRESVDQDGGATIQPEISEQVNKLGPGFAWVLGPHPEGKEKGHSFTLTPEGMLNHLFLTSFWLQQAPQTEGWHFYSSRQPSEDLKGAAIHLGEFKLKTEELWLTPEIDEEREIIHLTAWSPIFAETEEKTAYQVLFLLLDEALGENGVSQSLGRIEIKDDRLAHSFPLSELPEQVAATQAQFNWKKIPLEDSYTLYSFKQPEEGFPRQDLLTLNTQNPSITLDYFDAEGALEDPIADTGASYLFIRIPISQFPEGQQVDLRAKWEDALRETFESAQSGRVLGGGLGTQFAYIDVLIFDGEKSLATIKETLDRNEARKYSILPFARASS